MFCKPVITNRITSVNAYVSYPIEKLENPITRRLLSLREPLISLSILVNLLSGSLCIAVKLLSPQTYYPIRQITIFHQNSVVCPTLTNRTVKPNILLYSAFLDIETTHSTWLDCSRLMSKSAGLSRSFSEIYQRYF